MAEDTICFCKVLRKRRQLKESDAIKSVIDLFITGTEVWAKRESGSWQSGNIFGIMRSGIEVVVAWPHPKKNGYQGKEVPTEILLHWQHDNQAMPTIDSERPEPLLEKSDLEFICELLLQRSEAWIQREDGSWQGCEVFGIYNFGREIIVIFPSPEDGNQYQCITVFAEDFLHWQKEAPGLKDTQTLE